MTLTDHLRSLFDHDRWADDRLLDAAASLTVEQLASRPEGMSQPVLATLGHVAGARVVWLARITAAEPVVPLDRLGSADFAALRSTFDLARSALTEYVTNVTEAELDRPVEYGGSRGGPVRRTPVAALLFQILEHSVQHRAEVAMAVTAAGYSPGDLDYLTFLNAR